MSIDLRSYCRSARTILWRPGGLRKSAPPCAVEHRLIYADQREPTSGLEPLTCSLRVIHQVLQGFAGVCKSRIPKRLSLLWIAACCTVLRSRWCQSGVNIALAASARVSALGMALRPLAGYSYRFRLHSLASPRGIRPPVVIGVRTDRPAICEQRHAVLHQRPF
jgi:hypothetical protein